MDWVIIGIVCLLLLLLLLKNGKPNIQKLTARDDVRGYSLVYADQKQGKKHEEDFGKLLYSAKYELQGKPDYVFQSPFLKNQGVSRPQLCLQQPSGSIFPCLFPASSRCQKSLAFLGL